MDTGDKVNSPCTWRFWFMLKVNCFRHWKVCQLSTFLSKPFLVLPLPFANFNICVGPISNAGAFLQMNPLPVQIIYTVIQERQIASYRLSYGKYWSSRRVIIVQICRPSAFMKWKNLNGQLLAAHAAGGAINDIFSRGCCTTGELISSLYYYNDRSFQFFG